jgi:glycerophosphoryl diester phosphodiesterase
MNLWLEDRGRVFVIGHRGASAHAPENTLAAFALAHEQGADGIELDVDCCASGEPIVIHDDTVDRTTNGSGDVRSMTLEQLRALDAGRGERIPLLDEVLAYVKSQDRFLVNIEIKGFGFKNVGVENTVAQTVRRHACEERVLFSSFNPLSVRRLSKLIPDVPRAILYDRTMSIFYRKVWFEPFMPHEFRHPDYTMVTRDYVEHLREQGKRVNCWTVNDSDQIKRVCACGVSGIIGDSPKKIIEALSA